jgi:hypothetical protein
MSDETPPGFSVTRDHLGDLIFQIEEIRSAAASANDGGAFNAAIKRRGGQMLDEMARGGRAVSMWDVLEHIAPAFAAERRQSRRRLKAWKRERDRLADDVSRRQIPFVVLALNEGPEELTDAACDVVRISDFLFEADAPIGLIMDLFRLAERLLPDAEDKPA